MINLVGQSKQIQLVVTGFKIHARKLTKCE